MRSLVIIAQTGYQDIELSGTLQGLSAVADEMTIASSTKGTCTGKFGGKTEASLALQDVNVEEFDRIVFIGGPGAAALAQDAQALRIAKEADEKGKILGAICIAPTILAAAGVLHGKRATVWDSGGQQIAFLQAHGAVYSAEDVVVDDKIITANGPKAAEEFGRRLVMMY